MTERELSIIRALGEEFSTVLADLQRTFEGKMASQAQAFEEKLTSLSAVLQKHVTVDEVRPVLQAMVDEAVGAIPVPRDGRDYDPDVLQQAVNGGRKMCVLQMVKEAVFLFRVMVVIMIRMYCSRR